MNSVIEKDRHRRGGGIPAFQKYYRLCQSASNPISRTVYNTLFRYYKSKRGIELDYQTQIGEGVYFGHAYGITINGKAIIGKNCNIHKGVTIGQENRGARKGTPIIGDEVWIGVNATIVGSVKIGDDVLIAPNTFVNHDIPSHSVVFGNPCQIKHKDYATERYISNKI